MRTEFDVQAVQAMISDFNTRKTQFNEAAEDIRKTMDTLNDTWKGIASTTFTAKVFELYSNLRTIEEDINVGVKNLQQAIADYQEADDTAAGKFDNIDPGQSDYV